MHYLLSQTDTLIKNTLFWNLIWNYDQLLLESKIKITYIRIYTRFPHSGPMWRNRIKIMVKIFRYMLLAIIHPRSDFSGILHKPRVQCWHGLLSHAPSSAWDIKTKERHWWRHNGDSDRRPLSLPLRYDLVTLCLYDDLGQINVLAGILKLRKRFRMSQILFEHGINSLPLVCFRGYGNLSTLSIAIPRLAFGRAWYWDAACG